MKSAPLGRFSSFQGSLPIFGQCALEERWSFLVLDLRMEEESRWPRAAILAPDSVFILPFQSSDRGRLLRLTIPLIQFNQQLTFLSRSQRPLPRIPFLAVSHHSIEALSSSRFCQLFRNTNRTVTDFDLLLSRLPLTLSVVVQPTLTALRGPPVTLTTTTAVCTTTPVWDAFNSINTNIPVFRDNPDRSLGDLSWPFLITPSSQLDLNTRFPRQR
ncbi:hypothetical protein BDZ45DRAFT_747509 [Acephala macrosclerotiorum]|nr:hypothetical protein BDZ45DRAFT_747509 [Acephala macrosclerotiorum]